MSVKLFGIRLSVSYPLICAVAMCVISGVYRVVLYGASAVVIHEAGHLTAMLIIGELPESISVKLFKIDITDRLRHHRSEKNNLFVIFSGPAANFICFIVSYLLYLKGNTVCLPFAAANASVGLLNSLPVMSLDGGQLIYLLLTPRTGSGKAQRVVDVLTVCAIVPLAVLGVLTLLRSRYNVSLLVVCGYLILSLFFRDDGYF